MQGKHILLGVTGGIAAYKSADLVRRLRERGAESKQVDAAGDDGWDIPGGWVLSSHMTPRCGVDC